MRILHIANVRWFNATVWYAMELARLQQAAGHQVRVAVLPGTLAEAAGEKRGLSLVRLDHNTRTPWGMARLARAIGELTSRFRPQVVNCHRGEHFWMWAALRRLRRDFALIRTRGDQRPPKNDPINRWLHLQADAVISTNSATTRRFLAMGLPHERIFCVLGGVDTETFFPNPEARKRVRAKLGYTGDHLVLGLLGRLDTVKGQREIIEALRILHHRGHRHLRLLLLGFSSALAEATVQDWIRVAGLEGAVTLTGSVEPVAEYLNAVDLAVVPSLWSEAIARAALEWIACGVPTLASTVGVLPDLFAPEALVPPGDVAAWVQRIEQAMDADVRTRLRDLQDQRLPELTSEAFLAATMDVYARALTRVERPR